MVEKHGSLIRDITRQWHETLIRERPKFPRRENLPTLNMGASFDSNAGGDSASELVFPIVQLNIFTWLF
ncbi:MAG: hypothetical protein V3S64_10215, partial [bacterium]